jgi:diguanylate cyclase (GGDEF)-like protein
MYQTPSPNPSPDPSRSRKMRKRRSDRRRLEVSLELALAALLTLAVVVGLLAAGGTGRLVEVAVVVIAVAVAALAGWPSSGHAALGAAAGYLIIETLAGRLDTDHLAGQLLLTAGILGAVLAAGFARGEREPREARQPAAVAASAAPDEAPRANGSNGESRTRERARTSLRPRPGTLEYEVERARRTERPLSVLAVRADENEAAGPAPPELLDLIEEAITGTMRAVDVIVRTGQSRFEVVLPETDAEGARTLAERIRLRIDSTRPDPGTGISVSIGVASFPADGSDHIELSAAAVQALDRAAELGGNRTVLYSLPEGAPPGWAMTR